MAGGGSCGRVVVDQVEGPFAVVTVSTARRVGCHFGLRLMTAEGPWYNRGLGSQEEDNGGIGT
jgi:hypothetical protein